MDLSRGTPWRGRRSILSMISCQEQDITMNGMNCFIDLPRQVFSLTYLGDNETQNPESLESLAGFRKRIWQTYLVGYLNNFTYKESEINSLQKALNKALNPEVPTGEGLKYVCEVAVTEDLNPTENDSPAVSITVREVNEEMEDSKQVFEGYLMSWCNPETVTRTLLPLLLCNGRKKVRVVVLDILTKRFDVLPTPLVLMQEDMLHLSVYALIMLGEYDTGEAVLHFKIPPGVIKLAVPIKDMLTLWSHVHQSDNDEVELDEVLLFHNALELFCETTFGIKLNCAHFQKMEVRGHFILHVNSQIWSSSTRIIHVLLKYLSYIAVQRLKVKTLERIHQMTEVSHS